MATGPKKRRVGVAALYPANNETITYTGDVTIPFNLEVTKNLTVDQNAMVVGSVSGASVGATGPLTGGSLAVTGDVGGVTVTASGAISGASVAATGDVGAATLTATGAISGDTVLATNGITSTNGDVTSGGDVVATTGSGLMQAKTIQTTTGDITSAGDVVATNALSGDSVQATNGITSTNGDITSGGDVVATTGSGLIQGKSIESTTGDVTSGADVIATTGTGLIQGKSLQATAGDIIASVGDISAGGGLSGTTVTASATTNMASFGGADGVVLPSPSRIDFKWSTAATYGTIARSNIRTIGHGANDDDLLLGTIGGLVIDSDSDLIGTPNGISGNKCLSVYYSGSGTTGSTTLLFSVDLRNLLTIPAASSDPSGVAQGLYYNSTENVLRFYNGSAYKTLAPASYEEGTFTPTLQYGATTVTPTVSDGCYRRIGNLVTVTVWYDFTNDITGGGTTALAFTNMPFAATSEVTQTPVATIGNHARFNNPAADYMFGKFVGVTTTMGLYWSYTRTSTSTGPLTVSAGQTTASGAKNISFTITYPTSGY